MVARIASRFSLLLLAAPPLLVLAAPPLWAQAVGERVVPTNQVVISGYGTIGYNYRPFGEKENEFASTFNPIFLFQFQDRVLFEAELEFELEEGVTETGLEYAQVDIMLADNLTLVGGKFLLPFGVFGERLHPDLDKQVSHGAAHLRASRGRVRS